MRASLLSGRAVLMVMLAAASAAWAQVPGIGPQPYEDYPYQIAYASSLLAGDSVINITNTGASGAQFAAQLSATGPTTGAICVNAYVFAPDEQMVSCCSCAVTPNGLKSLSVRRDLISNTLTPAVPNNVVVKLLASFPDSNGTCQNSASAPLGVTQGVGGAAATSIATLPVGMRAWMKTTHSLAGSTIQSTEFPFSPATLSSDTTGSVPVTPNIGELGRLRQLCTFIQANGSGFGICGSCFLGGLGSNRQ